MSLIDYTPKTEPKVSLKTALKRMRSLWYRDEVSNFDKRLASILECSLLEAEKIRENWEEFFSDLGKQGKHGKNRGNKHVTMR